MNLNLLQNYGISKLNVINTLITNITIIHIFITLILFRLNFCRYFKIINYYLLLY
jgi:hypothetical protein